MDNSNCRCRKTGLSETSELKFPKMRLCGRLGRKSRFPIYLGLLTKDKRSNLARLLNLFRPLLALVGP